MCTYLYIVWNIIIKFSAYFKAHDVYVYKQKYRNGFIAIYFNKMNAKTKQNKSARF